ncbi:uncharacterized protein LOC132273907 [Cornus florida]|uniref:uncharacterized protein LOC132273907 n=1 Tax=Cornus florida TaxID=4283 RepID=UPI00289C28FE|nr:uncharacterized protein LOC132273907 [Cornus florida]
MATDTDHHHHHTYCNNWSRSDCLPSDPQHPQEVSISELIDHGSISFGRFAAESLAWEKWSVFSHNRYQEEVEKFKAPGLVAQKKAYFEEYYKKIRAMKKMQAEQQETSHESDPCQEEQSTITEAESSVSNITKAKEERKPNNASQFIILETATVTDKEPFGETSGNNLSVTEQESNTRDGSVSNGDEISSSTIKPEHFANKSVPKAKPTPSVKRFSGTTRQENLFSSTLGVYKSMDHAPLMKDKTAASARKETKVECRTMKNAVKPAEKPNSSLDRDITSKKNGLVSSKKTTSKVASNKSTTDSSYRSSTEVRSSVTIMRDSVLKDKPASSSASIRGGVAKANMNFKGLGNKSTSKEITVTGAARKMDLEKRTRAGVAGKSLELSSCHVIPKRGQSEKQKLKAMSVPVQNKSSQNFGNEFGSNKVRGRHNEVINAGSGRVPKPASYLASGTIKAPNQKLEHKVGPWHSVDLTHARREPGHKMPSWR